MMEETKDDKPKPVKLPYFHRVLSAEETALIGDTTPKPITEPAPAETTAANKLASGSAWNSANTWEERDCTKWAMDKLPKLFEREELPKTNQYTVLIKGLSNPQGSAQIAHVRGKARFIYELSFELKFSITDGSDKKYKGKVEVTDVINDQLDDLELAVTWAGQSPPGSELATVRNTVIGGTALRKLIRAKMAIFEQDFRQI